MAVFRPCKPDHRCGGAPQHMLGQPVEPFNIAKGGDYRCIVQPRNLPSVQDLGGDQHLPRVEPCA